MRILDKIEFLLEDMELEEGYWRDRIINPNKYKELDKDKKKKKVSKSGKEDHSQEKKRAWKEELEELKGTLQHPKTLECEVCGKPHVYEDMKHFQTPRGLHSVCNECIAKKGKKETKKETLKEAGLKDITKFIKGMKGKKKPKDIMKSLMDKFDISKDDAERAMELVE